MFETMSTGTRIVSIGQDSDPAQEPHSQDAVDTLELTDAVDQEETPYDWEDAPSPSRSGLVAPVLACVTVAGWTAFFAWANRVAILAGATPGQWIDWIVAWASPVLLVLALWLLAMRTSKREAARFNDAARALSQESSQLEQRLNVVNRELSLAREFIASQSRDIEALGRIACERLAEHSDRLAGLIHDNGRQVEAIASVSTTALDNMNRLRGELPVIANSARDVTNQIGAAGRTAHGQLDTLISGFHRLNEFGEASERQVHSLRVQVDGALAAFDRQATKLGEITEGRFATLNARSEEFQAELESREVATHAAIRRRAETLSAELANGFAALAAREDEGLQALGQRLTALREESMAISRQLRDDETTALESWTAAIERLREDVQQALQEIADLDNSALESSQARLIALKEEAARVDTGLAASDAAFAAAIDQRRAQSDALHQESIARIEQQLAAMDAAIAARLAGHEHAGARLTAQGEQLAGHLDAVSERLRDLATQGGQVDEVLSRSLAALAGQLSQSRALLSGADGEIAQLTDASVRLLELIVAATDQTQNRLPEALGATEARLGTLNDQADGLRLMLGEAEDKGRALSEYVIAAQRDVGSTRSEIEALYGQIEQRHAVSSTGIADLRAAISALAAESDDLSRKGQEDLQAAIQQLRDATGRVLVELNDSTNDAVLALAERIGEASAQAIDRAVRLHAAEAIGQLEQSAAHASGISREATVQLRDQLAKVDELTAHLETRVAHARRRAEEQMDNDFSRRVALITESLNSNAIDIAKALSNEVTDTAWASYLKGDRGIFTRRAVRLLDTAESRAVTQIYETDGDFRTHVNQYVHDFEAMLRELLSTRDGHRLSVTLLSSDMGKLYVVLAQAIERLRA